MFIVFGHLAFISGQFIRDHYFEATTAAALLVALFGAAFWAWWRRPILKLYFEPVPPYCRNATIRVGERRIDTVWVRVRVVNEGRSSAKACKGKFIGVYEPLGNFSSDFDAVLLRWSGMPTEQALRPIDLAPHEHNYLDVLYSRADVIAAIIAGDPTPAGHSKLLRAPGIYRIAVRVYAENADSGLARYDVRHSRCPLGLTMSIASGEIVFQQPAIALAEVEAPPVNVASSALTPVTELPANLTSTHARTDGTLPPANTFHPGSSAGAAEPRLPDPPF